MLGFQPPAIGDEEIAAVTETLRSGWLTTGPRSAELERRMAEYLGAEHVLALASGTAAMHLALVALGVGPGDEVITTSITWPATVNVIVHAGATPVFVDVLRRATSTSIPALVAEARHAADERRSCRSTSTDSRPISIRCSSSGFRSSRTLLTLPRAVSRAEDRRDRRRDLLLALRDEEHRGRRGRDHRDEPRRRSRRPCAT